MPNGVMARNGGRWGIAALVAIVLLGLGLRVGEAWDGRAPGFGAAARPARPPRGLRRRPLRGDRPHPRRRQRLPRRRRRDPTVERLLPRPAPLRRRHLQGDRRSPRTPRPPRPRPARNPRDRLLLPDRDAA